MLAIAVSYIVDIVKQSSGTSCVGWYTTFFDRFTHKTFCLLPTCSEKLVLIMGIFLWWLFLCWYSWSCLSLDKKEGYFCNSSECDATLKSRHQSQAARHELCCKAVTVAAHMAAHSTNSAGELLQLEKWKGTKEETT